MAARRRWSTRACRRRRPFYDLFEVENQARWAPRILTGEDEPRLPVCSRHPHISGRTCWLSRRAPEETREEFEKLPRKKLCNRRKKSGEQCTNTGHVRFLPGRWVSPSLRTSVRQTESAVWPEGVHRERPAALMRKFHGIGKRSATLSRTRGMSHRGWQRNRPCR